MKTCSKCALSKPLAEFYPYKSSPDGHQARCKRCHIQAVRRSEVKHRDSMLARRRAYAKRETKRIAEQSATYQKTHPEVFANIMQRRRARAKHSGVFLVTAKDLKRLYAQPCIYCGSRISVEIDHVLPISRGGRHSIGNLAPACMKCNRSKNAKTVMEWRKATKP